MSFKKLITGISLFVVAAAVFVLPVLGCSQQENNPPPDNGQNGNQATNSAPGQAPNQGAGLQSEPTPTQTASPSKPTASNSQPSGPVKGKWISTEIVGNTVSILLSEVEENWNTHFKVKAESTEMNFMAYKYKDVIYVRANVCPPCRSIGYTLDGDELVCDRCATIFNAKTGAGIKGACVNYPKALVEYAIEDGKIAMQMSDLANAYEETIKTG